MRSEAMNRLIEDIRAQGPLPGATSGPTRLAKLENQVAALESAICPQVAARLTRLERHQEVVREIVNKNIRAQEAIDAKVEARLARLERALGHVALELVKET